MGVAAAARGALLLATKLLSIHARLAAALAERPVAGGLSIAEPCCGWITT
jgi:hypothetical protein